MNYKFYTLSSYAWDAMLSEIKKAKKSIYWESYILHNDTPDHDFVSVLSAKARAGVRVKIIIDAIGGFFLDSTTKKELEDSGAEVLFFNRLIPWWNPYRFKRWWFNRNHKKLLIIDEEVGFIGGVNVGQRYADWLDLHMKLKGVIVRFLVRSFAVSYSLSGGRDKISYRPVFKPQNSDVRFFHHSPLTQRSILKKYYKKACESAKKSIVVITPYLAPQPWLIKSLGRALKRGVRVEVLFPKKSDYRVTDWANYTFAHVLNHFGANIFLTKKMNHAKALLVDDKEGMVGSPNLDNFSFNYNFESGVIFERKNMVEDLKKILDKWKKESEQAKFNLRNKNFSWRVRELLASVISAFL